MKKVVFFTPIFTACLAFMLTEQIQAQAVEVTDETAVEGARSQPVAAPAKEPQVGTEAARKYFRARQAPDSAPRSPAATGDRYLALHIGTFISEDTYKWGGGGRDDVGQLNTGVTYKMGEWTGSMDLMFKADVTTYKLTEGRAVKLSLMPAVTFPDVDSGFPLYFGAGAGLGVFFKQIEDESSLSFDYAIFAGARIFDVFENVGLLFEAGIKNHILLLSDGQYNGVYVNFGAVFSF
ncbi:MAG: hypothetical protein AB7N80_10620 [Bdellovibrionales bacterium]